MLSLPLSTRPELAFNWATLTASVSASPAATLEILLPPLSKPSLVRLTACLPLFGAGVRVMPVAVVSALLPSLSEMLLPSALKALWPPSVLLNSMPFAFSKLVLPLASVSSILPATDLVVLPALSVKVLPSAVEALTSPSFPTKVTLPPLMVVELPSVSNRALFKPCKSLASLTLSVPLASSETTPMLLLSDSLVASASPPLTVTVLPNWRVEGVPLSPAKVKGARTALLKAVNAVPTSL